MSTREIIAYVVGTAGCVAIGWAVHGLLLTGSCGDFGQSVCPPETARHFGALAGGVIAVVVAVIAGAGPAALGVFLALAVAALSAAVELPPGERAVPILLTVVFGGLVVAPLAVLPFLLRRRRADARLAAVGAEAVGTVTEVHDTGVTINDNPRVRLTVRIRPADGSTAFTADTTLVV